MPVWLVELIGALAAIIGTLCWMPQFIKTVKSRDTKSLSLWTNVFLLTAMMLWLVYGIAIGSWPLVASNAFSMVLVSTIVVLKIRHG